MTPTKSVFSMWHIAALAVAVIIAAGLFIMSIKRDSATPSPPTNIPTPMTNLSDPQASLMQQFIAEVGPIPETACYDTSRGISPDGEEYNQKLITATQSLLANPVTY